MTKGRTKGIDQRKLFRIDFEEPVFTPELVVPLFIALLCFAQPAFSELLQHTYYLL